MARPQAIQLLKHGKALCGSVFRLFVETWNYVAQRCDGIVGDRDVNADLGCIYVDNSNPERPVIRLDKSKLPKSESGGGSAVPGMALFAYDADSHVIAGGAICFARRYYQVNSFTVTASGAHRIKVTMGSSPSAVIEAGDGFAAPNASYAYIPLYTFDSDLAITSDWRGAPCVQAWEGSVS